MVLEDLVKQIIDVNVLKVRSKEHFSDKEENVEIMNTNTRNRLLPY